MNNEEKSGIVSRLAALIPGKALGVGIIVVVVIALFSLGGQIMEDVDADELVVIQAPISGDLTWYTTQGWKPQWFGKVTRYKKRSQYTFDTTDPSKPGKCSDGIEVRFNDGGHATMCGSIQYDMPVDEKNLTALHTKFGSQAAIQRQLIETIVGKSIYLSGPLMSSRESFAEKRNDLLFYVEDQVQNGVYKTHQREDRVKDSLTGVDKTVLTVEIVRGKAGIAERQEDAVLNQFGIKAFNFTIKRLPYDNTVEAQIKQQQQITMDVQTAIAGAKKAEQRAITVSKEGEANAAEAKWKQETIKAQKVTEAEQEKAVAITAAEKDRDVNKLQKDAAEYYKQQQILRGEGDAAYRRKVMDADGALEKKLTTYVAVMGKFAEEFGKQKWVPEVQMGGAGTSGANSAQTMIDVLSTKALRDLGLDMKMEASRRAATVAAEEVAAAQPKSAAKPAVKK